MTSKNSIVKLNEIRKQLLDFISASEKADPLIQFIVALCTIDAAANYWFGRPSVRCSSVVFKSFVELCLPKYSTFSKQIYSSFRCKLVHALTLGGNIALVAGNREAHLKFFDKEHMIFVKDSADKKIPVIINLESFVEGITEGINNLFDDATRKSDPVNAPTIKMDESTKDYKIFYKDYYSKTIFIAKDQYEAITEIEEFADEKDKFIHWREIREVYPELKEKLKVMREIEKVDVITLEQNILMASRHISLLQVFNLMPCGKACVDNSTSTPNYDVFQYGNSLTCNF